MESTLKTPTDLNEPYFLYESNIDPSNLVRSSQILLSSLSPKLKHSFRLLITFSDEKAHFRLFLDTSLWFRVYLQTMPDFAKAVGIARQYITNT
jgi:hypothetical protein